MKKTWTEIGTNGTIFAKSSQLLGFADDLVIIIRNMETVKEKFVALDGKRTEFELKVFGT